MTCYPQQHSPAPSISGASRATSAVSMGTDYGESRRFTQTADPNGIPEIVFSPTAVPNCIGDASGEAIEILAACSGHHQLTFSS